MSAGRVSGGQGQVTEKRELTDFEGIKNSEALCEKVSGATCGLFCGANGDPWLGVCNFPKFSHWCGGDELDKSAEKEDGGVVFESRRCQRENQQKVTNAASCACFVTPTGDNCYFACC